MLGRLGLVLLRSSGSHFIYGNGERLRITVPAHAGKILHPKVLQNIIRDTGLSVGGFMRLLGE